MSFQCHTEESLISVSMTLNVDYQQLGADDKVELKSKIREVLAKSANVNQDAVSVSFPPGSVNHALPPAAVMVMQGRPYLGPGCSHGHARLVVAKAISTTKLFD